MIFKKYIEKIKNHLFDRRIYFSKRKNFLDSLTILFTTYSIFLFLFFFLNLNLFKLQNLMDFLFYYLSFVYVLPLILATNHSIIYSSILEIHKEKLKIIKKPFNLPKDNNLTLLKVFNHK